MCHKITIRTKESSCWIKLTLREHPNLVLHLFSGERFFGSTLKQDPGVKEQAGEQRILFVLSNLQLFSAFDSFASKIVAAAGVSSPSLFVVPCLHFDSMLATFHELHVSSTMV